MLSTGSLVPLKASSVRVDMCGLAGEQDPDSDLGGVDCVWTVAYRKDFRSDGQKKTCLLCR